MLTRGRTDDISSRLIRLHNELFRMKDKEYSQSNNAAAMVIVSLLLFTTNTLSQTVTYTYDQGPNGIGRLSSVSDATGRTSIEYDQRGNPVQTTKEIEGNIFVVKKTYDTLNRVTNITYPDSETVAHSYNAAGQIASVGSYVTDIQYNEFGQRTSISMSNGTSTSYSYDPGSRRLTQVITANSSGIDLQNLRYSYDSDGNVLSIFDDKAPTNNQIFTYDHLARIQSAIGSYGTLNYAYDAIGNLLCNSQLGSCSENSPNYSYPSSGSGSVQPHAVSQAGDNSYQYDANGNMVSGAGRNLYYDINNRPVRITQGNDTVNFAYNYKGNRVKKSKQGSVTTYYGGKLFEQSGIETTDFIFVGPVRIAAKHSDGRVLYYHGNHLGSTHIVTDSTGNMVEKIQYYPFGDTISDTGGEFVKHKYTSQELDTETGLYYYQARYYDPTLARFLSADTIVPELSNPQTLNRYSYVNNNPLRYTDPTGHIAQQNTHNGSPYSFSMRFNSNGNSFSSFGPGNSFGTGSRSLRAPANYFKPNFIDPLDYIKIPLALVSFAMNPPNGYFAKEAIARNTVRERIPFGETWLFDRYETAKGTPLFARQGEFSLLAASTKRVGTENDWHQPIPQPPIAITGYTLWPENLVAPLVVDLSFTPLSESYDFLSNIGLTNEFDSLPNFDFSASSSSSGARDFMSDISLDTSSSMGNSDQFP